VTEPITRIHQPPVPDVIDGGAEVVRIIKPRGETIDLITTPAELGALEIPQPTEPMHVGTTFQAPAPARQRSAPWHRAGAPWLLLLAGVAVAIVAVVGALCVHLLLRVKP
jgi:hypothetical protein